LVFGVCVAHDFLNAIKKTCCRGPFLACL
jgi:hypothetical protein